MQKFKKSLTAALLLVWDTAAVVASTVLGFFLYNGFNYRVPQNYLMSGRIYYILLCVAIALICNAILGCYTSVWSRAGVGDFLRQTVSMLFSFLLMALVNYQKQTHWPLEMIINIALLELVLMVFARLSVRFGSWLKSRIALFLKHSSMMSVLIFGAGEAGTNLLQKLQTHPDENLRAVAFLDDDKSLWGRKVLGIPVLGGREKMAEAIREYEIGEVIIAIPTVSRDTLKEALDCCHKLRCRLKRFGTIDDVKEPDLKNARISDINLEDLLRRSSVKLNMNTVKNFLDGKTVLVTGGAGSIGSEICRQVLTFGIKKLIIFDIFENGLYEINNELKKKFDQSSYELVLGSVRDRNRLDEVFEAYHPQVVFHAAAHKHVPMMELNPKEAIKNNVFGTINVANEAILHKAEKMILISTDKAVNPTNIMGASKRIAEMVIQSFENLSDTEFAAVRFGNVLGSSGSVVPLFKKQIAEGGPVTVTDRRMRRYFMTIPEAVQLVLEAGAMANGGEIFVLDMGEPVYIYDMVCDLIRLSGLEPEKDIKIEFVGMRPGEKLFEEISLADEDVSQTQNKKIYICKPMEYDETRLSQLIRDMGQKMNEYTVGQLFRDVGELVPTFHHNG